MPQPEPQPAGRYSALVLAAQRPGVVDPLAAANGQQHKCLIDLQGRPMIGWVLEALLDTGFIGRVLISIEDEAVLANKPALERWLRDPRVQVVPSAASLAGSVESALDGDAGPVFPALITTADNPLLTSAMLAHFCLQLEAAGAQAGAAMTRADCLKARYPDGQRRFYRFRDDAYSNCNLYAITGERALATARLFAGGGQFRKKASRMLRAFGPISFLLYRLRLLSLADLGRRLSSGFGFPLKFVDMPFAEAPIDVDNERTLALARAILADRGAPAGR